MAKIRAFVLILFIVIILFSGQSNAAGKAVYIDGADLTEELNIKMDNGQLLVKARSLAESLGAGIKWVQSIKTLSLHKSELTVKMMAGSSYIQVNDKTSKITGSLLIEGGQTYIPLKPVVDSFGYLVQENNDAIYIFKPEGLVQEIKWQQEGQSLLLKMDKITPYRINQTDDPRKFIIEVDRAALAGDFKDEITGNNYYLRVEKTEKRARIKFIVTSEYPISYHRDVGIKEDNNNIIFSFMPHITAINWQDEQLEIFANGEIGRAEVSLLQNPRRLVVDIPGMILNDFKLSLPYNEWIKDVRVSQFKYNPVILRVVVELKEGKYLNLAEGSQSEKLILKPGQQIRVSNLQYQENKLTFRTNREMKPDIFSLQNPDRVVINLINAVRGEGFPDILEVDNTLVKKIRTARFNEETIRIVADMNEFTGYTWEQTEETGGGLKHTIVLKNTLEEIGLTDYGKKTDINLSFTGKVKYEVKKFSYPDRLVVDIEGLVNNINEDILPEPAGIVKDVRVSQFSSEPEVLRVVFELDKYYGYNLLSANPDSAISISIASEKIEEGTDLIVVDAGHGGFDPGAIGASGLREKDVNLDLALRVNRKLKDSGFEVLLTRNDDQFISLRERVKKANEAKASLFVSIHINASNAKYSEGIETYLAPNKVASSNLLAEILQKELVRELKLYDRGIKKENLYVIKYSSMPAALVEVAFISNPHEESLLESELFREKAARAIYRGIIEYLDKNEQGDEAIDE